MRSARRLGSVFRDQEIAVLRGNPTKLKCLYVFSSFPGKAEKSPFSFASSLPLLATLDVLRLAFDRGAVGNLKAAVFGAFNSHRCLAELLQVVLVAVKPINFPLCSGATFLPKVSDLLVNFLY